MQKGKPSRLTTERIDKLNRLGFVWEAKRGAPRQIVASDDKDRATPTDGPSDEQEKPSSGALPADQGTTPPNSQTRHGSQDARASTSAAATLSPHSRGMGPVSPRGSASTSPRNIQSLPPVAAAAPTAARAGGFPFDTDPPRPIHEAAPYFPPHQSPLRSYFYPPPATYSPAAQFPPMFPPPYFPPPAAGIAQPYEATGRTSPSRPSAQMPWWPMAPPTGRVLTPLFPHVEFPPGVGRSYPEGARQDTREHHRPSAMTAYGSSSGGRQADPRQDSSRTTADYGSRGGGQGEGGRIAAAGNSEGNMAADGESGSRRTAQDDEQTSGQYFPGYY